MIDYKRLNEISRRFKTIIGSVALRKHRNINGRIVCRILNSNSWDTRFQARFDHGVHSVGAIVWKSREIQIIWSGLSFVEIYRWYCSDTCSDCVHMLVEGGASQSRAWSALYVCFFPVASPLVHVLHPRVYWSRTKRLFADRTVCPRKKSVDRMVSVGFGRGKYLHCRDVRYGARRSGRGGVHVAPVFYGHKVFAANGYLVHRVGLRGRWAGILLDNVSKQSDHLHIALGFLLHSPRVLLVLLVI